MTQYEHKSSVRTDADNLFWGLWIRWQALTVAERFVCANIVLIPVWWIVGLYRLMPLLLLLSVALHEWWQYRELRLKSPSLPVVALLAFGAYQVVRVLLFYYVPQREIKISDVVIFSFCPAFWLWYIQSNNIRIRMNVVAWACTVSVVQMIGFWLVLQFVLPENFLWSLRVPNLFTLLTGKLSNSKGDYLLPYLPRTLVGEVNRFSLFFLYPEFFAVVAGFIGLVALDIKNRLWSGLLFLACVFLIFLSATRMVWVAFPIVIGLRYLFSTFGKRWGPPVIFALTAVVSFTILSLPPATDLLLDKFTDGVQSVNELRAGSSETRFQIYKQTWEEIQDNPFWGYPTRGEPVQLYNSSSVGSHSVILGNLLYLNGLVGTVIFIVFWISLFIWFYETRKERPLTCLCLLTFYTLVSPTLALVYEMPISSLIILLCATIRRPEIKSAPNKSLFKKLRHA